VVRNNNDDNNNDNSILRIFRNAFLLFRKRDENYVELVDGNHLCQPCEVVGFVQYFERVFSNPYLRDSSTTSRSSDSLFLT
jgi:hypothetical protein